MNPYGEAWVQLSMGGAPAHVYYAAQARREREGRVEADRKQALHERAVARRRKSKRGGKR